MVYSSLVRANKLILHDLLLNCMKINWLLCLKGGLVFMVLTAYHEINLRRFYDSRNVDIFF